MKTVAEIKQYLQAEIARFKNLAEGYRQTYIKTRDEVHESRRIKFADRATEFQALLDKIED